MAFRLSRTGYLRTRRRRKLVAGCGIGLVAIALLITACASDQSAIGRVIMAMNQDAGALPPSAQAELSRFKETYDTYVADAEDRERLDYFNFAFRRVRASYVEEIDDRAMIDAAIAGVRDSGREPGAAPSALVIEDALHSMLKALDPHSSYLNAEEFQESFASTKGEFGGLGIQVTMENDLVKVISPIEGTPAERAGILAGDLITHVDGVGVEGKTLRDAVDLMRGKPGDPVDLVVRREGVEDFEVRIVRAIIEVKSVRHRLEGDVGYIRITRFNEKTKEGLNEAINDIRDQAGAGLKGVVVDLRNNPGGLLAQSVIVADAFLEDGKIVSIKGRDGRGERAYYADPGDAFRNVPMVVLVNRGSASASEIVASALQQHGRATVMGAKTFGKGSVQTIMPLPLEGALRLTTALYYSPADKTIQAIGVTPDIDIVTEGQSAEAKREADLPGAIPAQGASTEKAHPSVDEADCPEVGENKDRALGCALTFLRAGSQQAFFTNLKPAPQG